MAFQQKPPTFETFTHEHFLRSYITLLKVSVRIIWCGATKPFSLTQRFPTCTPAGCHPIASWKRRTRGRELSKSAVRLQGRAASSAGWGGGAGEEWETLPSVFRGEKTNQPPTPKEGSLTSSSNSVWTLLTHSGVYHYCSLAVVRGVVRCQQQRPYSLLCPSKVIIS